MHATTRIFLWTLCVLAASTAATAQDAYSSFTQTKINEIKNLRSKGKVEAKSVEPILNLGANEMADEVRDRVVKKASKLALQGLDPFQIAESASTNISNGNSPLSSAATSLVTKAISSLLGIAEEAGALTSSSSGSSTTLTANIPTIARLLNANPKPCYVISQNCSFGSKLIEGASASFSFNSSSSTLPNGTTLSSAALSGLTGTQTPVFSSFSFQQNFHGRKNQVVSKEAFESSLKQIAQTSAADTLSTIFQTIQTQMTVFYQNHQYNRLRLQACYNSLGEDGIADDILANRVNTCIDDIATDAESISGMESLLKQYTQAETAYFPVRETALEKLFYQNTFSIEYDLTNNLNQPMTSTFKGIYGYQSKSGNLQTTANGSVTLYDTLGGSSESRIRSAQAAVQFDYSPATAPKLTAAYSGAYYFQYMVANGLINLPSTAFAPGTTIPLPDNASVLLNTKGPIHIGQGKITLKVKGSNVSIPLALTLASRTDLIKANRVSGNFGISYDFSSLLQAKQ